MEQESQDTDSTTVRSKKHGRLKLLGAIFGFLALAVVPLLGSKLFAAEEYKPVTLLAPQPTIVNAPTRPVGEIGSDLGPTELVIGVTVDGVSRAYPINMLTGPSREIINDTLAGTAIAATW